jgi:hypothetical protein
MEASWREKIKNLGIDFYDQVSMKGLLEDPVRTKIWTAATLPNDNLSIENAIIMFKSRRWPLMIDPQNQANKFIKNLGKDEAESGLDVFKIHVGRSPFLQFGSRTAARRCHGEKKEGGRWRKKRNLPTKKHKKGFSCAAFPPLALIPLMVPPRFLFPGPGVKRCICNTRVTAGPRKLCLMRECL